MRAWILGGAVALFLALGAAPGSASAGQVLVYDNQTAYDPGFTQFGQATGESITTQDALPDDLGSYACVLLNLNQAPFTAEEVSGLSRYLARGGSVIAIGDWGLFAARADATINDLVSALGGHMSLNADFVDVGFGATTNIDPSPLTAGVSSIQYAGASTLTVSSPAESLVRSRKSGAVIAAVENLGGGQLVVLGDSDMINDDSADAYTAHDNGPLMRNVCRDQPLGVTGQPVSATEGQLFDGTVATVSGDPDSAPSDYSVLIDWGDGSTSAGSVDPSGAVTGSHTYAEEGSYTVATTVTDSDSPTNSASGSSVGSVGDAPLTASATAVTTQLSFAGPVASFTDANPAASASDFASTVDWGDGTSSGGVVSPGPGGGFDVSGSHTYAQTGRYEVSVHIADDGGSGAGAGAQVLAYEFAAGGGSFVIGDEEAAVGSEVDFWGADWPGQNSMSLGTAPASFRGFAGGASSTPPACGESFLTAPGSSSGPPPTVPSYMGTFVATGVRKQGPLLAGDIAHIVVVRTDPGDQSGSGRPSTGQVVAQVC